MSSSRVMPMPASSTASVRARASHVTEMASGGGGAAPGAASSSRAVSERSRAFSSASDALDSSSRRKTCLSV